MVRRGSWSLWQLKFNCTKKKKKKSPNCQVLGDDDPRLNNQNLNIVVKVLAWMGEMGPPCHFPNEFRKVVICKRIMKSTY